MSQRATVPFAKRKGTRASEAMLAGDARQGLGERSPIRQTSNLDRHEAEATATSSGPTERWKTASFSTAVDRAHGLATWADAETKVKDPVQHPVYAAMKDRTSPFGTKGDAIKRSEIAGVCPGRSLVAAPPTKQPKPANHPQANQTRPKSKSIIPIPPIPVQHPVHPCEFPKITIDS